MSTICLPALKAFLLSSPLQPGSRPRFNRPQHFQLSFENGDKVQRLTLGKPGIGGRDLLYEPKDDWECPKSTEDRRGWAVDSRQDRFETLPKWIAKDKQVLRFDSYFLEIIPDEEQHLHGLENERLHNCIILYYLEDDSIKVVEPHHPNSGIPQGKG